MQLASTAEPPRSPQKGKPSQQPAQVWGKVNHGGNVEHKSTLTSLLSELGVGGAGFEKFTMTLAQRSHKLTGGSGLHRWQLIGVSPLRPSAADNRDTGAGPLSTTAPLLRLFISRGSGKKKKQQPVEGRKITADVLREETDT